jgi:hypothetical protein
MNDFLGFVYGYGFPLGLALAGMAAIFVGFGAVLSFPRQLLFIFLICLVMFASSSTYGLEDVTEQTVFWVKGTRTFFFSFVEMGIFGAWLAMLFRQAWQRDRDAMLPTTKYYVGFGLLLVGFVMAGLFEPRHPLLRDLSQRGFTNIIWQGMFVSLLVSTVRTGEDLRRIALAIVVCLFFRDLFGLLRFVAFGGDPQNAYDTLGSSHVRVTFWDINDSVFAAFSLGYCAWRLLAGSSLTTWQRVFYAAAGLMAMLIPALSARRTAQGGLFLALVAVAWLLPRGRRWPIVLALALAVPLALIALGNRSEHVHSSLLDRVLIDVKTNRFSDPRQSRFYELTTAWQTVKHSPVIGLGPSGSFKVTDSTGLEYHGGTFDFVHSGFGHVMLKTGVVGLLLFCGIFLAWGVHLRSAFARATGPGLGLLIAAVSGMAASVPNLLVGTPVPDLRTMLGLGLFIALPFIVTRLRAPAVAFAAKTTDRAVPPLRPRAYAAQPIR